MNEKPENISQTPNLAIIYLVHAPFQPALGGLSVCILAYSIGTPSQTPFFNIAILYNLPTSLPPSAGSPILARSSGVIPQSSIRRRASHACDMLLYWRSSSRSRRRRWEATCERQARWMVQWRRARVREKRRGRGVSGCWRW